MKRLFQHKYQTTSASRDGHKEEHTRLAELSQGGDGRVSLSDGELQNVRDWEALKEEQAVATEGKCRSRF